MQTSFVSSSFEAIVKKIDGVFPIIASKLNSLPSKILYPLSRSSAGNSGTRNFSAIKSSRGEPAVDELVPESTLDTRSSHQSSNADYQTQSRYNRHSDKFVEKTTKELALGFYDAPYFITEKKYYQRTILDRRIAKQLRIHLPIIPRSSNFWTVLYGSSNDGFNLNTLHSLCDMQKSQLLVISALPCAPAKLLSPTFDPSRTEENAVFGAFMNEGLKVYNDFYGSSSCFLWRKGLRFSSKSSSNTLINNGNSVSAHSSGTTTHWNRRASVNTATNTDYISVNDYMLNTEKYSPTSTRRLSDDSPIITSSRAPSYTGTSSQSDTDSSCTESIDGSASLRSSILSNSSFVEIYRPTGSDSRYVFSDGSFIALGIGRIGKFGLWLSKHLDYGFTSPSATYGNPSLLDGSSEGSHFRVCSIEVWGLG